MELCQSIDKNCTHEVQKEYENKLNQTEVIQSKNFLKRFFVFLAKQTKFNMLKKILKYIEVALISGILLVISLTLILAFVDIVYEIMQKVMRSPRFIIEASGLMDLFSLLLVLLIGLELLETVKAYLKDDIVHVEFIILVAIIAIARKVIVWDFNKYSVEELLSLAAMTVGLGITYFLIKKSGSKISISKKYSREQNKAD